jgi:hypothetical protein
MRMAFNKRVSNCESILPGAADRQIGRFRVRNELKMWAYMTTNSNDDLTSSQLTSSATSTTNYNLRLVISVWSVFSPTHQYHRNARGRMYLTGSLLISE